MFFSLGLYAIVLVAVAVLIIVVVVLLQLCKLDKYVAMNTSLEAYSFVPLVLEQL